MKGLKRVLSLLIAAVLAMSMAGTVFAAEEYEETDEYVLNHNVSDDDYDDPRFQYFSPYITDYAYDGSPSYIQSNIFSLYNTITKEVIPAYCTDIKVGALPDHRYRRQNLEDSTHAAGSAGLLRAIVQEGFYIVPDSAQTTEEHAARVAEKLQELGKASRVTDLTIGEAISGTQTAIWQADHGSELVFTDFVRTICTTKMPSATKYYDLCNEERINGHVNYTVSNYGKVTLDEEADVWLNANAGMGEEISNQAILHYTNSVNFDFEVESDEPVVYTGGVNLRKVDAGDNGTVLAGAVFELYRAATAEEVTAGSENLTTIAGVVGPVVKVSFFDNGALHGERVTEVISDEEGKVTVYGLAFGEYYLLETQAPAGYNLLGDAMKLTINATSHTEENEIVIANVSGAILPETGGIGTWVFTVTGITLMLFSTVCGLQYMKIQALEALYQLAPNREVLRKNPETKAVSGFSVCRKSPA